MKVLFASVFTCKQHRPHSTIHHLRHNRILCWKSPSALQSPHLYFSQLFSCSTTMGPQAFDYNDKIFRSASNTANGEVSSSTSFHYRQHGNIVWAEYAGGSIAKGFLIATVQPDQSLDARYEHVNVTGQLMTGICRSVPELLNDGRIRLKEKWQWTSGDESSGESVVEESKG